MNKKGRKPGVPQMSIVGQRFGRLVAIKPSHQSKKKAFYWLFQCDCGRTTVTLPAYVKSGDTKSCGCLHRERAKRLNIGTHRKSNSPEWCSWRAMRKRCLCPSYHAYPRYGGRGITICERWASFEAFYSDMGPRPPNTTLDRIDNNGNYEPGNCRWADRLTQNRNRRRRDPETVKNRKGLRKITIDGETKILSEWSKLSGIPIGTIFNRLERGWPEQFLLSKQNHRNNSPMRKVKE